MTLRNPGRLWGINPSVTLLAPISARRQLNDLSDDIATRISILYYGDAREALAKALGD